MNYSKLIKQFLFTSNDFEKSIRKYNSQRNITQWPSICHAPFRNMYIGHHGVVTACCFNRTHPLGTWPIKTLKEIWNSTHADELRESLKDYDLSKGCMQCANQLSAQNIEGIKAKQYDYNKKNSNKFPSVLEFELDNKCNLACTMCSEEFSSVIANAKGLPKYKTPYNDNFLKELKEFIPYLTESKFYGGEPFMIKIYYEIWELIQEINPTCRISIQTNATIMNNRVEQLLKHPNIHLNISIDSLEKSSYEKIRVGASYKETMKNIDVLYQYSKKNRTFFGISACMMKSNVHEAPDFIRFCNQLDIAIYFHNVVQPEELSLHSLDQESLQKVITSLQKEKFEASTKVQKQNILHYNDFILQLKHWEQNDYQELKKKHQKPIESWEDLYTRIEVAALNIYGEETGKIKTENFILNIETLRTEKVFDDEYKLFSKILHEDISSSVHLFIDMDIEQIRQSFKNLT